MKKRDYLLFAITIVCIIISSMIVYTLPLKEEAYLTIKVEDKIYGNYALEKDQIIEINDSNTCIIKDGKVYMSHANCPDLLCVHSKAIDKRGGSIVCLPNRIVLEIIANKQEIDTMT